MLECASLALLAAGPLEAPADKMPNSFSDRGAQLKAKSIRQFFEHRGIAQGIARYNISEDHCFIERWFKTVNEKLYRQELKDPLGVKEVVSEFIDYYNYERRHQRIGFVTPAQRHTGLDRQIIANRKEELDRARQSRMERTQRRQRSLGKGQKVADGDEMVGISQMVFSENSTGFSEKACSFGK